ncbi:hypothetical protein K490DRAFT_67631 [Saccharata proteae CBS 121410]|uniref:Uncharacterized protein n=1 Tax=Saccharata proteae CBS 121410 TaxID=1314787 RepID=A0A9P4HRQ6_9PEZI|nr:hypothetical protein K490DRAFT_67631 [Saccharata proteae CBS 121410]
MAGIEIAGLVLGALPLVIEGLEKYREAFQPLSDWWSFETTFVNFIESARWEQHRFEGNIERLLDFVQSDSEMDALLQDPLGARWREKRLQEQVHERLGHSYESVADIIRKMNSEVVALQTRLQLHGDQTNEYIAKNDWQKEFLRLRISFSKKKFRHIKRLEASNDKLRELLELNRQLESSRKRRKNTPLFKLMETIRSNAQSLFQDLQQPSAWTCSCQDEHHYGLLLESVSTDFENHDPVTFSSIFQIRGSIYPVHISNVTVDEQKPSTTATSANDKYTELKRQVLARPSLRKVPKPHSDSGGVMASLTSLDPNSRDTNNPTWTTTDLRMMLAKPGEGSSGPDSTSTREDRFRLASIITWTFLQYQGTPWMRSSPTKKDIVFPYKGLSGRLDCQSPFVFQSVSSLASPENSDMISVDTIDSKTACQQSLLSLSIFLLELCFGQALEDQPFRRKYLGPDGLPNDFTDECTARQWHRQVQGECGDDISDAIDRCLRCSFGPKADWTNGEFVQAVYQDVIQPLDRFLSQWRRGDFLVFKPPGQEPAARDPFTDTDEAA